MALIDKASLLMVPSTYEAGKLYNVLPSGNRAPDSTDQNSGYDQTRADFDFDRGSNASATRIGSDGLIKKYRENLLLQSNQFDDSGDWGLQNATLTSGQIGYDVSLNAWLFSHSSSNAFLYQAKNLSASINTISIYAKQGASTTIRLDFVTGSFVKGASCYFDLSNGTAGSVTHYGSSSGFLAAISSVGNDWYRISLTGLTTAETWYYELALTSGSIYIQSAQLESGLVATDYLDSTSVTGKAGVLVDLPRINYDANGENGALLLEPQRANLLAQSEYFGAWNNVSYPVTITSNVATSPDGNLNATLITPTSGSNRHATRDLNISAVSGTTYTLSAFYKKAGSRYVVLGDSGDSLWHLVTADLDNGTITDETNATGTIEPYKNDWYRITCTYTYGGTGNVQTFLGASPVDTNTSAPSFDDTSLTTYVYGAQVEANATYVSSYIPTMGTSETRAADSCSVTGVSDVIGQTEGTLFVEAETLENGADCRITISDNTINNRVSIEWDANADTIKGFIGVGGNLATTSYDQTNRNKIAIVYNSTDARFFVNGTKLQTDTSVPSLSGMDRIEFSNFAAALPFVGKVYKMYISEEKLTDAEAITLTTL